MTTDELKAYVDSVIYENEGGEISATQHNILLKTVIDHFAASTASFDGSRPITAANQTPAGAGTAGVVGGTTVTEFLESYFYPYVPATISMNSGTQYYEVGTSNTINLVGSITSNDELIFSDRIIVSPSGSSTLFQTFAGSGYDIDATAVQTTSSYQAKVTVGNTGTGPGDIRSSSRYATFVYPYLYGVTATVLAAGTIYDHFSPTEKFINPKPAAYTTVEYTATDEYLYFAYPQSYGLLSIIKDNNNFDLTDTFTIFSWNIGSSTLFSDWSNVPYYVYRTTDVTTVNTKDFIFYI